jgi:hypothetical protein
MGAQAYFVGAVAVSLLTGLSSPMVVVLMALHPVWMPEMLRPTNETVFYGASLIVSTATLLVSALPAAIAERLGSGQDTANLVWLAGAAALLLLGLA